MKNRKYIDYTLPHGGKLRYVKNKVSKSTMFEIRFDGGTRLNTIPGLAHFVEHMFFTGTDELSKEEVSNKYYDYIRVNAQTSIKDIAFTGNVITKEFSSYLDLLNQMLTKSTFTQEAVEKECKIIQQEIASYRDRHYSKAWWLNNYNLFGREEYKYEILGTEKSVASVKSEDVKEYVKNNIVAESLIVNVTSPLSFRKIKRLIVEKIESKINSNPNFKFLPYWGDKIKKEKFLCLKYKDIGKTYITINFAFDFNVFDFETKRKIFLVMDLMNHMSGLNKSIRLDKSLVYSCYIEDCYYGDVAICVFRTECDKGNVNEVIRTFANYLKETLKNGFDEAVLKQVKHGMKHRKETSEPRVSKDFNRLDDYYFWGKILNNKKLNKIKENVTVEECNEWFKKIFAKPRVSATIYGDITKDELMSEDEFYDVFDFDKKKERDKATKSKSKSGKALKNKTNKKI